jgi:staphylococcal nuclease domain-containing protein 1
LSIHQYEPHYTHTHTHTHVGGSRYESKDVQNRLSAEEDSGKAKSFLRSLEKPEGVDGIIEYVISATRMRVYVPKKNCVISFMVQGVRTPSGKEPKDPTQDDAHTFNATVNQQATDFVRKSVTHNVVRLFITGLDNYSNFYGNLQFQGRELALQLVDSGLGYNMDYSNNPLVDDLARSQQNAQAQKRGMWESYTAPVADASSTDGQTDAQAKGQFFAIRVTECVDGASFFAARENDPNVAVINEALGEFTASMQSDPSQNGLEEDPSRGKMYAALFEGDQWYRVKVLGRTSPEDLKASQENGTAPQGNTGIYDCVYAEFGNAAMIAAADLRELPTAMQKMRPSAQLCSLTGVRAPKNNQADAQRAVEEFGAMVFDRVMQCRADAFESDTMYVTLQDEAGENVNGKILSAGLAKVPRSNPRGVAKDVLTAYRADMEVARGKYEGVWRYGDVSDGEEEEEADAQRRR